MMLSDHDLECLIRRAAPREIPLQMREVLARLIPPCGGPSPHPVWTAGVLATVALSALVAGGLVQRHGPACPGAGGTPHGTRTSAAVRTLSAPVQAPDDLPEDIDTPPHPLLQDLLQEMDAVFSLLPPQHDPPGSASSSQASVSPIRAFAA